jgi:hypothetical protein
MMLRASAARQQRWLACAPRLLAFRQQQAGLERRDARASARAAATVGLRATEP